MIRPQKVGGPVCNIDQGLSVHRVILAEMTLRLPEYVAETAFINCDRWHPGQSCSVFSPP